MAVTAITDLTSEHICLNKGSDQVRAVTGTISSDCAPGSWLWFDGDNQQWVPADASTGAHKLSKLGVLGYEKRVNQTTGALKLITDDYDVSQVEDKRATIYTSGIVVAKIIDQSATIPAGTEFIISTTVEEATITAHGTASNIGALAANVITGDLWAIFGIGKCHGDLWGGFNTGA